MKKKLYTLLATLILWFSAIAQNDQFPEYHSDNYSIAVNIDSMSSYVSDPMKTICGNIITYNVVGMAPAHQHRWISTSGGNQSALSVNSPTAALCKLLHSYASGLLTNITALYRPEDMPTINSIMADSASYTQFMTSINTINKMDFIMSVQLDIYTIAFVNLYNGNEAIGCVYYYLTETNGTWNFVSTMDSIHSLPENVLEYIDHHPAIGLVTSPDYDMDGVDNMEDNCPCTYNPNQQDMDHDGIGDECDNCPITYNPDQTDGDEDGIGDACDNCPRTYNPMQEDSDGDRVGDSCDNCPLVVNPRQLDFDSDSIGDECDPDIDGDGIPNEQDVDSDGDGIADSLDNCPIHYNPSQYDSDNDGIGDACDCCPLVANPGQEDRDGDGVGDACEPDLDHDGIPNNEDNCPESYNPDQSDRDCDGIGDLCDPDRDGDGVPNESDNCPDTFNPDQKDVNNNGIGDICE